MLSKGNPPGVAARSGRLRRSKWAIMVPLMVLVATLGLIAHSVWPMVHPAPTVRVGQVVFDRSATAASVDVAHVDGAIGASSAVGSARPGGGQTVQAAGWLEAEPFYHAAAALTDGVIQEVLALEGDFVERGAVVARLVDDDARLRVRRAEAALANARAELALAEAEARAAETAWNEPVELDRAVAAGHAALAESRAELAQLPSLIEASEATLLRLEEEHRRAAHSQERGATTELEVIIARQLAATQRAEVQAMRAREPLLEARAERLAADLRAAERALALRIDDRRRLDAAQAGTARARAMVEEMEALRDEAVLALERTVVFAPISGFVQKRHRVPGDKVAVMMDDPHSAHILHMYDPERLQVRVDVPLADASHVFVGQRCEVVVEVLPDRVFAGEVIRITHQADIQKNTLQMKVRVIEPSALLRPEMLARVRFLPGGGSERAGSGVGGGAGGVGAGGGSEGGVGEGRVLVPESALVERDGVARVWTIVNRQNNRGELRGVEVEPMDRADGWVRVSGSLVAGALVVLGDGPEREGARVRIGGDGGSGAGAGALGKESS